MSQATNLSSPGSTPYNEEAATRLCQLIQEDGLPEVRAAALVDLTPASVQHWKGRHPLFAARLERARAEYQQARLVSIREVRGRDGSVDWRAQAYLLENAHSAGNPELAETAAAGSTLSPLLVIPPEQLALLQQRRLAALTKMNP